MNNNAISNLDDEIRQALQARMIIYGKLKNAYELNIPEWQIQEMEKEHNKLTIKLNSLFEKRILNNRKLKNYRKIK